VATQVLSEVFDRTAARDTAWMVMVVLADHASKETREAQCSTQFLMDMTHKSERAVRYALRQLEEEIGEITTIRRGTGRKNYTVYRINQLTGKGATVAPFTEGQRGQPATEKGATVAPFTEGQRGQPATEKGATSDMERGQPATVSNSVKYSVNPNMSSSASRGSTARDQAKVILAELNRRTFKQPNRGFPPTDANLNLIVARIRETDVERTFNTMVRMILKWWGTDMQEFLRPATIFGQQKFSQYVGELGTPVRRHDGRPVKMAFTPEQLQSITEPLGDSAKMTR
jgi:uncharacterized phage protein (TIGR02220 family)